MSVVPDRVRATTFAVLIGSGGYFMPAMVIATNDVSITGNDEPNFSAVSEAAAVSQQVACLEQVFGLGKDQLAELLHVSRPTIYSWLNGTANSVRAENKQRVSFAYEMLENIEPELRIYFGALMRRKLDPQVQDISHFLALAEAAPDEQERVWKLVNFKLEGLQRSALLDERLDNSKPLIA
ncbi:MAG: hypothetical protein H6991_07765 [Pseudomonadales bacterium]|nr:hypothetical protein [Pseudomonadales bacterium]MCP5187653.1 hypothetical protein [Pseudomonadales bacterium]